MGAVDVCVGHDDQFVVAQFCCVKGTLVSDVVANTGAEGANHGLNFLILEYLCHVVHLPLNVQNLSSQRQDGLDAPVASGLGGTACGVALNQVNFAFLGFSGLAVGKFTGQTAAFQDPFSPSEVARLAGRFSRFGGQHGLVHNEFSNGRIFFKEFVQFLVDHGLDNAGDFAADEFVLCLRRERRVWMLDADDGSQPFSDVITGQTVVFEQLFLLGVAIDAARQRRAKAGHVGSTVLVSNDVRVAVDAFAEGIGPLERQLNRHRSFLNLLLTGDENGFGMQGFAACVDLLDKFGNASGIVMFHRVGFFAALVGDDNSQTGVQERCLFQTAVDLIEVKLNDVGEDRCIRLEGDRGPRVVARPNGFEVGDSDARFKSLLVDGPVAMDHDVHPFGYGVHRRHADPVQTAAHLVGAVVKFPAGVELGHDDLGR